jgi:hypothetical protein
MASSSPLVMHRIAVHAARIAAVRIGFPCFSGMIRIIHLLVSVFIVCA